MVIRLCDQTRSSQAFEHDVIVNLEDRSKAKGLLDEGLTIAEKLGMKPLHERITERLAKLKGKVTYPDRLTHREVEVLQSLAKGKTRR